MTYQHLCTMNHTMSLVTRCQLFQKQTANINRLVLGDKAKDKIVKYVPHGINERVFFPIEDKSQLQTTKKNYLGIKNLILYYSLIHVILEENVLVIYQLLTNYSQILYLKKKQIKVALVLHTQIVDDNGTDLNAVKTLLFGKKSNVFFSDQRIETAELNTIYNIADAVVLPSSNEGMGISFN